jgi:hypothetical protein
MGDRRVLGVLDMSGAQDAIGRWSAATMHVRGCVEIASAEGQHA